MKAHWILAPALPLAAALLTPPSLHAQGCSRPGMDIPQATHPYGPVKQDGQVDRLDVRTDIPLTLQYALPGLDHTSSLPLADQYATLGLYSLSPSSTPLELGPCFELGLPLNSPYLIAPTSLENNAQIAHPPGPVSWESDVWFQTLSMRISDGLIQTSDLAQLRLRQGPFVADPTTDQEYSCYYFGTYAWNAGDGVGTVTGRVAWPDNCNGDPDPAPGTHPLVVIVHGDGHHYEDYNYLMRHLALNGFIVASINGGQEQTNVERAERIRNYISFLRDNWTYRNSVENRIALLGHSRGGEAVLTAARKIDNDWNVDHEIEAVICLAPTDSDGNGGTEGLESLAGSDSRALLVIAGSMDEDVAGYCLDGTAPDCGQIPTKAQATGFSIYDRAGGEYSTEGLFLLDSAVTKSMLFVERADHNRWREGCIDPFPLAVNPPLDCDEHQDTLKGYANAFLRWRLFDEAEYKPFFTGEWTPDTVREHGIKLTTQFSEGYGRRVIDNFETGPWNQGTLASIVHDLSVTVMKKGTLYDTGNFSSPHDTDAMVIRWSGHPFAIDPFIRWSIQAGEGFGTGPFRDLSSFGALSVRLGQMDDAFGNIEGEDTIVWARLRDGMGNVSPNVWIDAFTDLSYPHEAQVFTPLQFLKTTTKSSMRTARVPLSYFSGVDLSDIRDIELVFGDNGDLQGQIAVDSLEIVP